MARTRLYRNGKLESEDFPVDDISEHLQDESAIVWLDVCRPTPDDFQKIGEELGLHALAIEDATSPHERPKLNHYQTHLFMTAYSATFDPTRSAFGPARGLRVHHQAGPDHRPDG